MEALKLRTADHNRVRGLFARFSAAEESGDVATMATLVQQIDVELDVHADIEETVFYPWARDLSREIADVVDEGIEEHGRHRGRALQVDLVAGADVGDRFLRADDPHPRRPQCPVSSRCFATNAAAWARRSRFSLERIELT